VREDVAPIYDRTGKNRRPRWYFWKDGGQTVFDCHRVVAAVCLVNPNKDVLTEVDHIHERHVDSFAKEDLRWSTPQDNKWKVGARRYLPAGTVKVLDDKFASGYMTPGEKKSDIRELYFRLKGQPYFKLMTVPRFGAVYGLPGHDWERVRVYVMDRWLAWTSDQKWKWKEHKDEYPGWEWLDHVQCREHVPPPPILRTAPTVNQEEQYFLPTRAKSKHKRPQDLSNTHLDGRGADDFGCWRCY
jgi:hypothetical protein